MQSPHGQAKRLQRLADPEAIHVFIDARGYFLPEVKCDPRPAKVQRYLGRLCDPKKTASFLAFHNKMNKLHNVLRAPV